MEEEDRRLVGGRKKDSDWSRISGFSIVSSKVRVPRLGSTEAFDFGVIERSHLVIITLCIFRLSQDPLVFFQVLGMALCSIIFCFFFRRLNLLS